MKKLLPVLLALVLGLSACGTAAPQESKTDDSVTVLAATTYPVYLFACAVTEGLDDYDVQLIIDQPVNCLHDYTLSVRDMKAIEAADVILINGAGLESAMEDALSSSGRKPVIDCSKGIELLPASGAEHEGAVHDNGSGDPHIWMDPALACQMTNTISDELSRLDPSHAEDFAGNAQAASSQISSCYDLCKEKLKDLSPREIITFHDGFAYFLPAQSEGPAHGRGPHTAPHKVWAAVPSEPGSEAGQSRHSCWASLRWVSAARDVEKGHCESRSAGSCQLPPRPLGGEGGRRLFSSGSVWKELPITIHGLPTQTFHPG